MAVDVALMARAATTGEAVLRVYTWALPTLSFGRNQVALGWYDQRRLREAGVDVVRRPTGGRAILHHREVTYSVTAPIGGGALRSTYTRINRIVANALARLGVPTEEAGSARRAPGPTAAPCFETPTAGELTSGGRKLVGSAQWRDDRALLQHGSILVEDDQRRIPLLMTSPTSDDPVPAPATLYALLGRRPGAEEIAGALFDALRTLEAPDAEPLDAADAVACAAAEKGRFSDPAWTWRR